MPVREGAYEPTDFQRQMFRYAAECGAQIVYNSHPHVLQPMEYWGESVIFYSLGNFCFGGNRNPSDKDTAILQVTVERQEDGTVMLEQVDALACSVTSTSGRNDYRPCLYASSSAGAVRVEQKLHGTYQPKATAPPSAETRRRENGKSGKPGRFHFIKNGTTCGSRRFFASIPGGCLFLRFRYNKGKLCVIQKILKIIVPVHNGGSGMLIAKETALSIVQEMKTASGCDINLMDETGRILASTDQARIGPDTRWSQRAFGKGTGPSGGL